MHAAASRSALRVLNLVIDMLSIGLLLGLSFVASLLALGGLIWALANRQLRLDAGEGRAILALGDRSTALTSRRALDTPAGFDRDQGAIDHAARMPVLALIVSGLAWLLVGSAFGLIASLKMHWPDWLVEHAPLTFGRVRALHLNLVIYGWLSMTGVGVAMWIIGRMFHTALRLRWLALSGTALWNLGVAAGAGAIAHGWTDGEEWLEIPWQIDVLLVLGGACFAVTLLATTAKRHVRHIYVSGWYYLAGLCWFPALFIISNLPGLYTGVQEATVNWWFAHNVLGLWLTPIGLGAAYYLIPKIIGRPIYSYGLSLLGFWGLALFYSQVGIHHLIGGPVPTWAATLSVVHSVMMFIPVIAVAINQHVTVARDAWALKASIPLRFISLGALGYTAASLQGVLEALRTVNTITHFTHYTVGHAHLGVYGFVSFVLFGAVYYLLPRLAGRPWPWPWMPSLHFWLVTLGFSLYFLALSIGGTLQGLAMLDPDRPFADSVVVTLPYLRMRSLGGALMSAGHLVFAANVLGLLLTRLPAAMMPSRPSDAMATEGRP